MSRKVEESDVIVGNVSGAGGRVLYLELATGGGDWNITNRYAFLRVKFISWSFNIHYMACQVNSAVPSLCSGTCSTLTSIVLGWVGGGFKGLGSPETS